MPVLALAVMRAALLRLDAALTAFAGAVLFFWPSLIASIFFTSASDGVHWHLIRCIGGQMLAFAFVLYRFRHSRSETLTCCFILRILGSILLLVATFHARSQFPQLISEPMITLLLVSSFSSITLYAFLLLHSGWQIGTTLNSSSRIGNCLYQLDTIASLSIGAAWLSVPQWLLHRQVAVELNETHAFLGRVMGSFFASSYVVSAHALYWPSNADRALAVDARSLVCVLILAAQVWSQWAYHYHWTGAHWVGISLFSIWTFVALVYRFTNTSFQKEKTR